MKINYFLIVLIAYSCNYEKGDKANLADHEVVSTNATTDSIQTIKFQDSVLTVVSKKVDPQNEEEVVYFHPSFLKDTVENDLGYSKAGVMNLYSTQDTSIKSVPYLLSNHAFILPMAVSVTRLGVCVMNIEADSIASTYYSGGLKYPVLISDKENDLILSINHGELERGKDWVEFMAVVLMNPTKNAIKRTYFDYAINGVVKIPEVAKNIKGFEFFYKNKADRDFAMYLLDLMEHDSIVAKPMFSE